MTQPLLHPQLVEWGIDISSAQLNRLLTEARHRGKNGSCTFIDNEHYQRLVIEAVLIGSILHHGFSIDTVYPSIPLQLLFHLKQAYNSSSTSRSFFHD